MNVNNPGSSTSTTITSGDLWELKNSDGFVVFKVDEYGNFYHKGSQTKL